MYNSVHYSVQFVKDFFLGMPNTEAHWRQGVSAELGLYTNMPSMVEQDLNLRRALASIGAPCYT